MKNKLGILSALILSLAIAGSAFANPQDTTGNMSADKQMSKTTKSKKSKRHHRHHKAKMAKKKKSARSTKTTK